MNKIAPLLPFLLLAWSPHPATAQAVAPETTIDLLDGQDLDSFYTWLADSGREDPDRVFSIVDQVDGAPALRISGERWGGLVTKQAFRDYHLLVEFRWGLATWGDRRDSTRDSGVLIHCQGPDGSTGEGSSGPWMRSVETQVIEGGVGDFILVAGFDHEGRRVVPRLTAPVTADRDGESVYDPQGEPREFEGGRINWWGRDVDWEDRLGFRGRDDVESPYGEWTRLEVIADGDRITTLVNGTVVNEGTGSSLSEGQIMIQSEGAEIYFRRIEVGPLPPRIETLAGEEGFVPLFDGKTLDGWVLKGKTGAGYEVEDGKIVLPPGGGGNLLTAQEYSDFVLRFEFRLFEGSNNGLGIRAPLEARDVAYDGIELQIIDNTAERYRDIKPWQKHGSLYHVFPARTGYLKPVGEWNEEEVTARGSRVKVVLNGATILDVDTAGMTDPEILAKHPGLNRPSGHLGFLGHNEPVEFRNIRIYDLSGAATAR
ncbi:MAG: DUF1080 domain-containing protein [Acidobacteria bacterium]|nr:DUF1080 domain-containing protein [Acidobacteriota bacterium]